MTFYAQVTEGEWTNGPEVDRFKPWLNCSEERQEVERLVLNQAIRQRGGVGSEEVLTFTVWTFTDKSPRHKNGRPMIVHSTTFTVRKK